MLKKRLRILIASILASLSCASLLICQAFMYFQAEEELGDSDTITGLVGLRQYFDSGTGTQADPFLITRPSHLYNLSRLQGLGAFTSKKYFQVGKIPTDGTAYYVYGSDSGTTLDQKVLDMSSYTSANSRQFISIGTTSAPFLGEISGKDIIIKNLTVDSQPEDIGTFGYAASGSLIEHMVFSNLVITDKGYSSYLTGLYVPSTSYDSLTSLVTCSGSDISTSGLTYSNLEFTDLNKAFTLDDTITGLASTTTIDSTSYPITYSLRSTNSDLLKSSSEDTVLTIDNSSDGTLASNTDFNSKTTAANARIYVTGSVTYKNIKYAKIIATYSLVLGHSATSGKYDLTAYRDPDSASVFSYSHNTNIGFLVGHADGSVKDCYVYGGKFVLNSDSSSNYVMQKAESDDGLIGEIGINIDNKFSPQVDYEDAGDTGIINFTSIINNIITLNEESGNTEFTNYSSSFGNDNYTVYSFVPNTSSYYNDFLRVAFINGADHYVTNSETSIDFQGKQIIKENEDRTRGLGVFQLNTGNYDNSGTSSNYFTNLGEFTIQNDSANAFSDIYYTTAEYDNTDSSTSDIRTWKVGADTNPNKIYNQTVIPSVSNISLVDNLASSTLLTTNYFEKHFNYNIKFPLSSSLSDYYFADTSNSFIKDYFSHKLRDKAGDKMDSASYDFGVMIKERSSSGPINSSSLNSYLKLTSLKGGTIGSFTTNGSDNPSKTIQFNIENETGANVTICCSPTSSSACHVCLYKKDAAGNWKTNSSKNPQYSMYLPGNTISDSSSSTMPYYFLYNNTNKNIDSTSSKASLVTDGDNGLVSLGTSVTQNRLYAHTFYLPEAGDYFVGSPDGDVKVYYMAVQGQEGKGDVGGRNLIYLNSDTIANIDFLLYDPEQVFNSTCYAYSYITCYFYAVSGTFEVKAVNGVLNYIASSSTSLEKSLILNSQRKSVYFECGTTTMTTTNKYIKYNWS